MHWCSGHLYSARYTHHKQINTIALAHSSNDSAITLARKPLQTILSLVQTLSGCWLSQDHLLSQPWRTRHNDCSLKKTIQIRAKLWRSRGCVVAQASFIHFVVDLIHLINTLHSRLAAELILDKKKFSPLIVICISTYESLSLDEIWIVWILFRSIVSLARGLSGHVPGGLAPHQCRWAGVVWAARCCDGVMRFFWLWLFCAYPSFLLNGAIGLLATGADPHGGASWRQAGLLVQSLPHRCPGVLACVHMYMFVVCVYICVCIYVYGHVYMYIYTCVCLYVYVCKYTADQKSSTCAQLLTFRARVKTVRVAINCLSAQDGAWRDVPWKLSSINRH